RTYITPRGLIDRGLATNAIINIIDLKYKFNFEGEYSSQLKQLKEYEPRNILIQRIGDTVVTRGNTLVLFSHTEHGLTLFYKFLKSRGLNYDKKTYKDLAFQQRNNVFFINGMIEGSQRETIRQLIDSVDNAIIVANYATTSTGVNIKNLHNLVLASPLKSYVTITQSIGRLLRLHKSKDIVNIYDVADHNGFFKKQINARITKSYEPEGYEIKRFAYNI
ncbi:hypothetical protein DFW84_10100, partial [Campylobacter coli]|nr:hypothetical protein [Campylobacter coli]